MIDGLVHALGMAFAMGWEILWPLILGFTLSAAVQAVVSHREMSRLLPDDRPRSIATALLLGAASSLGQRRHRAHTPPWHSRARCSARAPISPRPWRSSWLPQIWYSNSAL